MYNLAKLLIIKLIKEIYVALTLLRECGHLASRIFSYGTYDLYQKKIKKSKKREKRLWSQGGV